MSIQHIAFESIRQDGGTQARAAMDQDAIEEYALAMAEGATFPPVVAFQEGEVYWLGDGFHRAAAHFKAFGFSPISADVHIGGLREARLFAIGANVEHGIRRTNADKRMAVNMLLQDIEWSSWSNREIAKRVGVSSTYVDKLRAGEGANVCTPESNNHIPKTDNVLPGTPARHEAQSEPAVPSPAKPANTPKPEPSEDVAALMARIAELETENAELNEQNVELTRMLKESEADNRSMWHTLDADPRITQALAEAKQFRALADVTQTRNNGLMNQNHALGKCAESWKRKFEKLEKKVKGMTTPDVESVEENIYFDAAAAASYDPLIDGLDPARVA